MMEIDWTTVDSYDKRLLNRYSTGGGPIMANVTETFETFGDDPGILIHQFSMGGASAYFIPFGVKKSAEAG